MRLEVENASFSYGKQLIFKDLSFSVEEKDVFCILGPNGCGKTTLLYALSGIYKLNKGRILLDGEDISKLPRNDIAMKIGFIPQENSVSFAYPVFTVVLMGRAPHLDIFSTPSKMDNDKAMAAIDAIGISKIKDKLYTNLSGGERRLVITARALAQEPKILIADEPTASLDVRNQILLLKTLKYLAETKNLMVIMTSHYPDHPMLFSNKVATMHNAAFSKIGPTEEVITEDNLLLTYGIQIKVFNLGEVNGRPVKVCVPIIDSVNIALK